MVREEKVTVGEYWKARLDKVPILDPSFTTEEQLRILHQRAQELEKKVKTLESILIILFIFPIVGLIISFTFTFLK